MRAKPSRPVASSFYDEVAVSFEGSRHSDLRIADLTSIYALWKPTRSPTIRPNGANMLPPLLRSIKDPMYRPPRVDTASSKPIESIAPKPIFTGIRPSTSIADEASASLTKEVIGRVLEKNIHKAL